VSSTGSSSTNEFIDPSLVREFCDEVVLAPGETLRTKGLLYATMYLLTAGEAEVAFDKTGKSAATITVGPGSPIGEISFITGVPATATVTAKTPTRAILITANAWREFEKKYPSTAVDLYRRLADVADGRLSHNVVFLGDETASQRKSSIEVVLCRSPQQLLEAQRIRYEVYCGELGRTSPYADHDKRTIADDLDGFGHVLLAIDNGAPVATLRVNATREGPLGALEELYGMASSPHHPQDTAISTKFIVKKDYRLGQASFHLMATALEFSQRFKIKHSFIDCVPHLLPFYRTLGFTQSAPAFLHRENGHSIPLMLDVERYAKRIARLTGFVLG
jgi:CRP-like cAMP-binding protein